MEVHDKQFRVRIGRRAFLRSAAVLAVAAGARATGASAAPPPHAPDHARWLTQAAHVTITRDDWGVPHVVGKTDADAVFGMIYAQAEDDFNRIERNYLVSLGRLAEAEGESAIWQDLRQRLFIDPEELKELYARSPAWLRKLMQAWADGLNYYLATHPEVQPRVITRFEPWMALSFTEGSIGGDIERVSLTQLEAFYDTGAAAMTAAAEPGRCSPNRARDRAHRLERHRDRAEPHAGRQCAAADQPAHQLLLPLEQHVTSGEGLNVYGAATWGQFFIYQGFNANAGWMHTSSAVDNVDEFAETIVTEADGSRSYRYGDALRPVTTKTITLSYRTADGGQARRSFTTFATHHGPIVRQADGKWIAFALMNKPIEALQQSFLRTKARDYADYIEVADLKANSSNNTLFADSKGNIAFLLPQFMPIRDDRFNYRSPSTAAIRRPTGKGCTASRASRTWSIRRTAGCTTRTTGPGRAAARTAPTPPTIRATSTRAPRTSAGGTRSGCCPREATSPCRRSATPPSIPTSARSPSSCRSSSRRGSACPTATSRRRSSRSRSSCSATGTIAGAWIRPRRRWPCSGAQGRATPMRSDSRRSTRRWTRLTQDFGSWQVPWGEINRFQRNDGAIAQTFDDAKPSIPVPFTSATWGSLASYPGSRRPGTERFYATSGNTFVSVVEFGPKLRAWAVREGGNSGDPDSPHFFDQAERFANGDLRPVYFDPKDLKGHIERTYKPGK